MNSLNFLFSAELRNALLIPKILFGLFALIFLGAIVYFIMSSGYYRIRFWQDLKEFFTTRSYGSSRIVKRWKKTRSRLAFPSESEHKLAIIEADGILNEIVEKMGYKGETLGDKLSQLTPVQFPNLEKAWQAHKIRNNIVHDPDYQLSLEDAKRALEIYEQIFQDLQAI